jgi:hypothetical protein
MNWRFWRKQYRVAVTENDYNVKIVKHMTATGKIQMQFFDFVKQEFNAEREWSWRTRENFLVFNNERDYVMFLLRMS